MSRFKLTGWLFVVPAIAIITLVMLLPMAHTVVLSFGENAMMPSRTEWWTGFGNYEALFTDERFIRSLINTLAFTAVTVPIELIIGIGLAMILHRSFAGRGIVRVAVLFPWALPTALNALIWRWMYSTDFGVFNGFLTDVGLIVEPINWLGSTSLAMLSMMAVAIWKTSSFMALLLLAGLQTIPDEIYEAGAIDGTTRWSAFQHLTLPLLAPSILVAVLLRSMDALRTFELPFNLTNGGPAGATETISLYAYRVLFQFIDFNFGASVVLVQFVIILVISIFYIRSIRTQT
jgi:ABC-type sugar transport system permease subunit